MGTPEGPAAGHFFLWHKKGVQGQPQDAVFRFPALLKHGAESVAFPVRKMLLPQQGVAEGQAGGDAVCLRQRQDLPGVLLTGPHPAAAPDAVRRSAVDGADTAPVVKVVPVLIKEGQKQLVEVIKLKQAGEMVMGRLFCFMACRRYRTCVLLRLNICLV